MVSLPDGRLRVLPRPTWSELDRSFMSRLTPVHGRTNVYETTDAE